MNSSNNTLIQFDKECVPTSEYVVLQIINRNDEIKLDQIYLPGNARANDRLGHYKVLAVGDKAASEYGLIPGDYVVADRLAQTYQTAPVAVMKYVNVIAKTNEANNQFEPLKNMVFVKDQIEETTKVGEIYIQNYNKKINIGTIVSMNIDPSITVPYQKGDKVMLSKGGDSFQIGNQHVFIYKYDMIACKVLDNSISQETK